MFDRCTPLSWIEFLTVQNARRIGVEQVVRFPQPSTTASDAEDYDLHHSVSPRASRAEHHWLREQMLAVDEPFLELAEMRIHLAWARPVLSHHEKSWPATGQPGAKAKAQRDEVVLRQIRCGFRRVLRLQFIRSEGRQSFVAQPGR